jgi:hypothetical protein
MKSWVAVMLGSTLALGAFMVSGGERLAPVYFPQRHFALTGEWSNPRFTGDVDSDSRVIAEMRDVQLILPIPARFTSPPQQISIFLILPSQVQGLRGGGGLVLTWTTRGVFEAGSVRPGERAVLFQGLAGSPELTDFMNFTFAIDAREMSQALRVEPIYEIELR